MHRGSSAGVRRVFPLALVVCAIPGCAFDPRSTRPWTLSQSQPAQRDALWRDDLHVLARELPRRHKNAFFARPQAEFAADVSNLERRIPDLSDADIVVALMRLVASLGDAHTRIEPSAVLPPLRLYPFGLSWFSDGIFVTSAPTEHAAVLGTRLVRVGNTDLDAAIPIVATAFPHENEATVQNQIPRFVRMSEVLHGVGLIDDPERASFAFRLSDGSELAVAFAPDEPDARREWVRWRADPETPLRGRQPNKAYWFERLPGSKTLYIKYNQCSSDPKDPFCSFASRALAEIDRGGIDRVILDLRDNGGGDSAVIWPLSVGLWARPTINRRGGLFIAIGRRTYSSAQLNAYELRRDTKAILVGEPTGQKPNAYGEIRPLELPNSGIKLTYSTKFFKTDPADPPSMMPDIRVETSSADYLAGRDPVLDAISAWRN